MLRYVSHELRTPLSILLTGLELLEGIVKDGGSTEEVVSTIEDLKQPCRTSVSILNDLLAYEKLDAGNSRRSCRTLVLSSNLLSLHLVFLLKASLFNL